MMMLPSTQVIEFDVAHNAQRRKAARRRARKAGGEPELAVMRLQLPHEVRYNRYS